MNNFCGGQLAALKISLTGKYASCGMEGESASSFPGGKFIQKHCCINHLTTLSVDSNYFPSFTKSIDVSQKAIHIFAVPFTEIAKKFTYALYSHPFLSPPGFYQPNVVELAYICVFRI